jgi:hypothetical protein
LPNKWKFNGVSSKSQWFLNLVTMLINTKTHTFCKGPSEEHSSYDFCQMFKKGKKKKSFPCGDCLLRFVFPIETPY